MRSILNKTVSPSAFVAIAVLCFLAVGTSSARAQEVSFSVHQYNGSLGLLPGEKMDDGMTSGESVGDGADEATTATLESENDAATTATVENDDIVTSASMENWDLMAAIVGSGELRAALSTPIAGSDAWETKKDSPIEFESGAGDRRGAIIAIDDQLRIKQLKPDLTDSIITAMSELQASANERRAAFESSQEEEMDPLRATLFALKFELNSPNPSARAIAELLANLHELQSSGITEE